MAGPAQLLATWEAGLATGDTNRGLLLHALARPSAVVEELLDATVGTRTADLFALRGRLFGDRMTVCLTCPGCGQVLEFDLDVGAVTSSVLPVSSEPQTIVRGAWTVEARPPTPNDLLAVRELGDLGAAHEALLERCVLAASRSGKAKRASEIPASVRQAVSAALLRADPGADVQLDATCPECGGQAPAELDIVPYLWAELDAWARSTLLDVHLLASSYGWTEPDVLALSPPRRRYYLELAGHA
ncbi:hypothetical protein [Flindersiella endophytica]